MTLILAAVGECPGRTKAQYVGDLAAEHHIGDKKIKDAWGALAAEAALVVKRAPVSEGGRTVNRDVWMLGSRRFKVPRSGDEPDLCCEPELPGESDAFPFNLGSTTEDEP